MCQVTVKKNQVSMSCGQGNAIATTRLQWSANGKNRNQDQLFRRHLRRLAFIGLQQNGQQWQGQGQKETLLPLPPPKNYPPPRTIQEEQQQQRAAIEREQGAIISRAKVTTLEKRQAEQKAIEMQKQAYDRARFVQQKKYDELFAPTSSLEMKSTGFTFQPDSSRGDNVGRLGVLQAQIRRCIAWSDSLAAQTTAKVVAQIGATKDDMRRKTLKDNTQATLNSLNAYTLILKQFLTVVEKAQADVLRAYGAALQQRQLESAAREPYNEAALKALSSHLDAILPAIAIAVRSIYQRPSIDRAFLDHLVVGEQELKILPRSQYHPDMFFCQSEIFMFQFMQRLASLFEELLALTSPSAPLYNIVKDASEKTKKAVVQYNQLKKTILEPQFCSVPYRKATYTCQRK